MAKKKSASGRSKVKGADATSGARVTTKKKSAKKKTAASGSSTKKAARKTAKRKKSGGRELIDTGRDKRFVRRDGQGQFTESDDVGRSLSQDRRKKAKRTVKAGQGDRGDQRRPTKKSKKARR